MYALFCALWRKHVFPFSPVGGACTLVISCGFYELSFFGLSSCIFIHAPPYSPFDILCFTLLLKRSYAVYFHCFFFFFFLHVSCYGAYTSVIYLLHSWVMENMAFPEQDHWQQLNVKFITSPTPSLRSSSLSLCFHSLTSHSVFASSAKHHPLLPPTLAALMQFHPQRWRADSYNYPSVCEMNHWAADWAAWWETSILSSTTECSQPSTPSLAGMNIFIATVEKDRVWSAAPVCCSRNYDIWQGNVVITNTVT